MCKKNGWEPFLLKVKLEEEERRAAVLRPPASSGPPPSSCFRAARLLLEILHLRENEATRQMVHTDQKRELNNILLQKSVKWW